MKKTLAATAILALTFSVHARERVLPNQDHYLLIPKGWFSHSHLHIGGGYAWARYNSDNDEEGSAATLDFQTPLSDTGFFIAGHVLATDIVKTARNDHDYFSGALALGVHYELSHELDVSFEAGPAYTHRSFGGAFTTQSDHDVDLYARAGIYTKLAPAVDFHAGLGVLEEFDADVSIDFRMTRAFSIAPYVRYRALDPATLFHAGVAIGFHFGTSGD